MSASIWSHLYPHDGKYQETDFPVVSIVLPTYNCAQTITLTLDSILSQNYPEFEIIIVDCSTDRTLDIIRSYTSERIHVFSVAHWQRYEMLNKGITQATGSYVSFLFPGDFYIGRDVLRFMMTLALDNNKPDLVYCGTLLHEIATESKLLYRPLTIDLLKSAKQPTSLQSCWFRTDTVRNIGKFRTDYSLRGGLDLLCRLMLTKEFRVASVYRVLTDYDLRLVTRQLVLTHFWESGKIVFGYFGLGSWFLWLIRQRDINRLIKLWLRHLKLAFIGK